MDKKYTEPVILTLLIGLIMGIAALLSFIVSGPGIVGVCGAVTPLLCAVPLSYFLFFNTTFSQRTKPALRLILPVMIPILCAVIINGVSLYDQNPRVIFKRLLSDPIPTGVSNIQSYDNSGGFDVEYGLAFEATPEVIDDLITQNGLVLDNGETNENYLNAPFKYFPNVKKSQEWTYYSKDDRETESSWFMWVNADRTTVLFVFIGY
ncbi:MAG: hypothetical protein HY869_22955 [Chloroflexi bacterium]|nr:hypothetical protein [Chloroflexota bacterium]